MELMVSAALLPSLLLCLCCLWFQMRSHRKSTRKIGDAKNVSDGRSSKGRRFSADELPGDTLDSIDEWDEDGKPRPRGQSAWQKAAAKAKQQARGRVQTSSWAVTTAKAQEHSRCQAIQISREANRLPPLPSGDGGVVERSWMRERTWVVERAHGPAAAESGDDPFARRELPSIRDAALGAMGDAPEPHRPSPMPALEQAGGEQLSLTHRSASGGALASICKSAIRHKIVAPRARRPAPPPPTEGEAGHRARSPSRWAALTGPLSASPKLPVPKAKRPPPPPPTSSPGNSPRRSLSTSFDEQKESEPAEERDQAPEAASAGAKPDVGRSASTPASKRSTVQILVPSDSKTGRDDRGGGVSCALSRTALSSHLAPLSTAKHQTLPPVPPPPPLAPLPPLQQPPPLEQPPPPLEQPPPPPPPPPPAGRSRWSNALSSYLAPLPYRDPPN